MTKGVERGITTGMASAMNLIQSNFMLTPRTVQSGSRNLQISFENTRQNEEGQQTVPSVRTITSEFRPRQEPTAHFHANDDDWSEPDEMPPLVSHSAPATTSRQTLLSRMQKSVEADKKYAFPSKNSAESDSQNMENTAPAGGLGDEVDRSVDSTQNTANTGIEQQAKLLAESGETIASVAALLASRNATTHEPSSETSSAPVTENPTVEQIPVEEVLAQLEAGDSNIPVGPIEKVSTLEEAKDLSAISLSSGEGSSDGTFRFPDDPNDEFPLVIDENAEPESPPKPLTREEALNYQPRAFKKRGKSHYATVNNQKAYYKQMFQVEVWKHEAQNVRRSNKPFHEALNLRTSNRRVNFKLVLIFKHSQNEKNLIQKIPEGNFI